MKNIISVFCTILLLALTACGGGGGGGSTPASTAATGSIINGTANLGVVSGGLVSIYKLDAQGVKILPALGTATTNANGTFTINVGAYNGPVLLELTNPGAATFINEATGATAALPTLVSSILPSVGANQTAAITPLTNIVASAAMKQIANNVPASSAITAVATQVANAFGLSGVDPLTVAPTDIFTATTATGAAGKYASVLAAIATQAATAGTAGANNGTSPGADLITQVNAYATAMFNTTTGQSQAPTGLPAADNFAALATASTTFSNTAVGVTVTPAVVAPTGLSYAGNSYYYTLVNYMNTDVVIDYLERGTMRLNATATNTTVTPVEAWLGTIPYNNLLPTFTAPMTVNQASGSWNVSSVTTPGGTTSPMQGNISPDGLAFAGAGIVAGATSNSIVYGVKKPTVNVTKAALAGKSFNFATQGSGSTTGVVTPNDVVATGSFTFSADGSTLTYVLNESINGAAATTTTLSNQPYSITPNGVVKMTYTPNGVIYLALSEGLKYGVYTEANYNSAAGIQFKNAGFIIARSNVTPNVANTSYNYVTSYIPVGGGLVNNTGQQVEQGLMPFNAQGVATVASNSVAMQQLTRAGVTSSCLVGACTGAGFTMTFTGNTNGGFSFSGPATMTGFASADGNVLAAPGYIGIKK